MRGQATGPLAVVPFLTEFTEPTEDTGRDTGSCEVKIRAKSVPY